MNISFFNSPIRNTLPRCCVTTKQIYSYLISTHAKENTQMLRSLITPNVRRAYKAQNFDYVTFSGRFSVRKNDGLIEHSGFMCFDIDKLPSEKQLQEIKLQLINDPQLHTVLLFRSPSGNGLKWVIEVPDRYWLGVSHTDDLSHTDNILHTDDILHTEDLSHTEDILHTERTDNTEDAVAAPAENRLINDFEQSEKSKFRELRAFRERKNNSVREKENSVREKENSVRNKNSAGVKSVEISRATLAQQESESLSPEGKKSFKSVLSVGENSIPEGTRSVNQRSLSLWRKNSVHSVVSVREKENSVREEKNDVIVKNHRVLYERIRQYLLTQYSIATDSTSDIARPCYLCHDPDAYYDEPTFHSNPAHPLLTSPHTCQHTTDNSQQINPNGNYRPLTFVTNNWDFTDQLIRRIEQRAIDITGDYLDWVRLGFAFANTFGELGRGFYHRVSQFHPRYNSNETNRQYDNCLKTNRGLVSLGTAIKLMHNS